MARRGTRAALLLALAGCAGSSGIARWGALEYDVPAPDRLVYAFSDTTTYAIDAGAMGGMRVASGQSGLAELSFRSSGRGLEATVGLLEYSGTFENPGQGATRAGEADIRGAWTVRLEPDGRLEIVDTPAVSAAARAIAGVESVVRPLFVRLPGGPPVAGATWVDTVSVTEASGGTISRARTVTTSTLAGDTLVGGRRLAVIGTESAISVEVEGASGGVAMSQRLRGVTRGTVLWDAARSLLVARSEAGRLEGTLELPGMGFAALPVEAAVRRTVSLRLPATPGP